MSALEEPPLVDAKSPLVQDSVSTSKGYYALSGKGLGLAATVAFIIGEMAGGGILALPQGVVQTGYIGTLVIVLAAAVSGYTGVLLGDCWGFLLKHWPAEYASSHVRHPYPAIGLRATGMWMHHTVAILVDVTLFGVSTVFLLLTSENLADLFPGHLNYRIWIIIVAAALIPLAWLESPKDAFWIAIAASAFTAVASIIVFTLILIQGPSEGLHVYREPVTFESFCLGIATIVFAFGGHASFPTYQHDMKDTSKFWLAVIISYVIILLFYVPVSAVASEYFLNTVAGNVLQNLSSGVASKIVKWMFTFHIFCGFIIVLNPVAQDVERLARVPQGENREFVTRRRNNIHVHVCCDINKSRGFDHCPRK